MHSSKDQDPEELANLSWTAFYMAKEMAAQREMSIRDLHTLKETLLTLDNYLEQATERERMGVTQENLYIEALQKLQQKYKEFCSEAKQSLSSIEIEVEKAEAESLFWRNKMEHMKEQETALISVFKTQSQDFQKIQSKSQDIPSESELREMNLDLRMLENENGSLLMERANLQTQKDRSKLQGTSVNTTIKSYDQQIQEMKNEISRMQGYRTLILQKLAAKNSAQ